MRVFRDYARRDYGLEMVDFADTLALEAEGRSGV